MNFRFHVMNITNEAQEEQIDSLLNRLNLEISSLDLVVSFIWPLMFSTVWPFLWPIIWPIVWPIMWPIKWDEIIQLITSHSVLPQNSIDQANSKTDFAHDFIENSRAKIAKIILIACYSVALVVIVALTGFSFTRHPRAPEIRAPISMLRSSSVSPSLYATTAINPSEVVITVSLVRN